MTSKAFRIKSNWRNRLRATKRKRFNPILQDIKWPLIGCLWVVAIILGYLGYHKHTLGLGIDGSGFDFLYRTLQLIVLESGDVVSPIPWQLNVARFLIPVLAGYTAIHGFMAIFRYQWQLLRARFFRKHLVLCGLGEKGLMLTQEFLKHGFQVVAIEKEGDNPVVEQVRRQGAVVLIGDATNPDMLAKSRIDRAKYLVTVCADDGDNAEIAFKACELFRPNQGRVLTAFVHIYDLDLCNLLSGWSLAAAAELGFFRVELFNVPSRAAHLMLREYTPFEKEEKTRRKEPRIVVIGLGKMGRSLIAQAAKTWWIKHAGSGLKLKIVAIDREVNRKLELLDAQYPRLDEACEFEAWQMDTDDHEFERGNYLFDSSGVCDVEVIYICFDNDVRGAVSALKLHRKTIGCETPIIVRVNRNAGLATLMNSKYRSTDFSRIHTYSILEKTCGLETVLGATHEILARVIHGNYIDHQKSIGVTPQENVSMAEWEDLPEDLKESNRHQASRIEEKLKAVGYSIQPLTDWEAVNFTFTPGEIEIMAEMEHQRWLEERLMQGWSYSKSAKNIKKKTSPYLVPWSELSEEIKELDRNTVRDLSTFLALAGLQICRKF